MESKIMDLSVQEFKNLISSTVKETIEELNEELLALGSDAYLNSIEEARKDWKTGNTVSFEEAFDV